MQRKLKCMNWMKMNKEYTEFGRDKVVLREKLIALDAYVYIRYEESPLLFDLSFNIKN